MPTVKPSEKTGHEGEWWRKDHKEHPDQSLVNPAKSTDSNQEALKEKFDEAMEPIKHPT
jgi:hypothetical protein